jgi:hypothetical protein
MKIAVCLGLIFIAASAPVWGADFNGDGADDIAVFRPSSGLWAVRGVTRAYFGTWNDEPVPGNYNGIAGDELAVYRATTGLWAIRGMTRAYFGAAGDIPVAAGGDADWYRSGTNLCALAAGNIGIGTGNPTARLDVTGAPGAITLLKIDQIGLDSWAGLRLDRDGSERWFLGMDPGGDGLIIRRNAAADDLYISTSGNVGIGNTIPTEKLDVAGSINVSGEVYKNGSQYNHPDYVFEPDYRLLSLAELGEFVRENRHLPGMPSTAEVRKDGVKIFEQNRLVLEKLEEAYLYILRQEESISRLEERLAALERSGS